MNKIAKLFIVLIMPFFIFASCSASNKYEYQTPSEKEYADGSEIKVKLSGREFLLTVSQSPQARIQGLSDRTEMPADGMIFFFETPQALSFWMKNMHFPIDIIWVNGNKVMSITKNAQPEPGISDEYLKRYFSDYYVNIVIELNAGDADKFKIKVGDILELK
ncbi:MAG: DUF192 domain-containing protein [Endomicrobia bacterium]|nr:DUF192 domain-containing protein [Endomicrobiia bacterium]MCL2506478.1 DUF192 domain-containing protein [Endomicrobiia bacterium]